MPTASGALAALTLLAPLATARLAFAQTPSTDFRTYAVIAGSQIKLGSGALVLGGNAAATDVGGILMVGKGARARCSVTPSATAPSCSPAPTSAGCSPTTPS